MTFPLSRLQWAMRGDGKRGPKRPVITAYDGDGGFGFRLEHPHDVEFMTNLILGGIRRIDEEQQKRQAYHQQAAQPDPSASKHWSAEEIRQIAEDERIVLKSADAIGPLDSLTPLSREQIVATLRALEGIPDDNGEALSGVPV